jgi:putative ubiquitin-RnfH superfamily antitoxin RatB of RatAB toxin-antitoxin module
VSDERFQVEVVYATQGRQVRVVVEVRAGTTVQQAIEASGVAAEFAEIDLRVNRVGIYGRLVTLDTLLRPSDRVEILRPLVIDPKEARRRRARRKAGKAPQDRGRG